VAKSRTAKSNLFRAFERSNQPVYLLDADRNIIFCNDALAEWVSEPVEKITSWRCDFHSLGKTDAIAAQLCPPLEAFRGQTGHGKISHDPGNGKIEFRNAAFLTLEQIEDRPSVLVIVEDHAAPKPRINTPAHSNNHYHDLLKRLRTEIGKNLGFEAILGISTASAKLRRQIQTLCQSASDIVIVGPTGSGRKKVAETIHYGATDQNRVTGLEADKQSPATSGLLIPINSSLCDPEMIQSTIRGLFADKDDSVPRMLILEAEKLSRPSQIELREFFEMPDFRLSVLVTAAESLVGLAEENRFDQDLAVRLSTFEIRIPRLQDRAEDIPLLVQALVEKSNANGGRQLAGANKAAMQLLRQYHWPGEYSELEATISAACESATGPNIVKDDLPKRLAQAESAREFATRPVEQIDLPEYLGEIEAELIRRAVAQAKGNKTQAAKLLGISRASLLRRWSQIENQNG